MSALREAFTAQAEHCRGLGSPFMGRLMDLLAAEFTHDCAPIAQRLFNWPGDVGPSGASLPLRLAGGLHALLLRGSAPELEPVYPPHEVSDRTLWAAVFAALQGHDAWLQEWMASPPQTNEIRRAAVIRAAGHWASARWGLPLDLLELGASAGLNLHWNAYALEARGVRFGPLDAVLTLAPDWRGPLPTPVQPQVVHRRGVDLAPPDLARPADRLRLLAYLWPDQPERLERTRAAMALPAARVDAGDAADWIAAALATPQPEGVTRMIYHTVAWQYFPPPVQARARATIEAAGTAATHARPLVSFGMEADNTGQRGAALHLQSWPGGARLKAGRACFHGRWVDWALDAPPPGPS
jgi:hypothetical protein